MFVTDAGGFGGFGEVLAVSQFRIGIGFEQVDSAVGRESQVDPGIAAEAECAVDAFAQVWDFRFQAGRQVVGSACGGADLFTIGEVPLDLAGGDPRGVVAELGELQLPDGEGL